MSAPTRTPTPLETSNQLVEANLHLVHHVVNQLAARYPRHVDREELWNAGALGLVDASRRFDPTAGIPFARYASIRIRGAIIDSTRGRDFSTRSLRRAGRAIMAAADAFAATNGRIPEEDELADALGVSLDHLGRLREGLRRATVLRLDQPAGHDDQEAVTLADLLEEGDARQLPQHDLEHRELIGSLLTAIEHLPHPIDEVVRRYYLDGDLLSTIALDLSVTEARVSQIRQEGLIALRAYFNQEFGELVEDVPDGTAGQRHRDTFLTSVAHVAWRDRVAAADRWAADQEPAALAS
ncbi:MAG TPA: sigma-70 family RNA polymerase sigma factor [Nitriliruptorales bacterium]